MPIVSVIIPVYNRVDELRRAIQSVLNQTFQDFEIIVVDDGSEENIEKVCIEFNDNRIQYHHNEKHTNANVARNIGTNNAKGEFIAMLDSDDEFLPNHLERRIEKIKGWKCDGIFGSAFIVNGEDRLLKLSRPLKNNETIINYLLSDGFAPTPSHFYNASAAKEITWNENLLRHQDYDFSIRFARVYNFVCDYEPTILIHWNDTTNKKINSQIIQSCLGFIKTYQKEIKPETLVTYFRQNYNTIIRNSNSEQIDFIRRSLDKIILNISFKDYLLLTSPRNIFESLQIRLKYTILVVFNSLKFNKR